MDCSVAIRAHWPKIVDWIDTVCHTDFRKHFQVMNVNDPNADITILCLEIKAANDATGTVVCDTRSPCLFVAFIGINCNLPNRAFFEFA